MPYIFRNERRPGIYQITNLVNGHKYIGSSKNVAQRLLVHRSHLRKDNHENKHLQNAWNKYGEDNFFFKVLFYCESSDLLKNESYLIRTEKPEYNKAFTFERYDGVPHTDEWKKKVSKKLKGRIMTKEHKQALSQAKSGDGHHMRKFLSVEIDEFRKICKHSGIRIGKIAKAWGISQSYASRLSRGERRNDVTLSS